MPETTYITITLQELVRFFLRGSIPALLAATVLAAAVFFLSRSWPPTYEARATILAVQSNPDLRSFGVSIVTVPVLDVSAYRKAALSTPVLAEAMRILGTSNPELSAIAGFREGLRVETEPARDSSLIDISVKGDSPEQAAAKANALALALIDWDRGRATENLIRLINALEQQIELLNQQIRSLEVPGAPAGQLEDRIGLRDQQQIQLTYARTVRDSAIGLLSVIEPGLPPTSPIAPRPALNSAVAAVLAVFLIYGLLLVRDALDTRLKSSDDLTRISGLPVIAEFPKLRPGNLRLPRDMSDYLRTNILLESKKSRSRIILVTSANTGEGASGVAMALAESFVNSNHHTLLIDANLRKPTLTREYKIDRGNHRSLSRYLEDASEPYVPVKVAINDSVSLDLIPSFGPVPSPTNLLSQGFRERLDKWRKQYDAIVIDSAPILPVADTLTIAPLSSGVVLTVNFERTNHRSLRKAVETLQRLGVGIIGLVATDTRETSRRSERYHDAPAPQRSPNPPAG